MTFPVSSYKFHTIMSYFAFLTTNTTSNIIQKHMQ